MPLALLHAAQPFLRPVVVMPVCDLTEAKGRLFMVYPQQIRMLIVLVIVAMIALMVGLGIGKLNSGSGMGDAAARAVVAIVSR
jgi:hypothetical protein